MDLTHLTDKELLENTTEHVRIDKENLVATLYHFMEVERRRLHCEAKCDSVYKWAMKVHGYSESEANSRVKAMRLLVQVPELEQKIKDKEINLTQTIDIAKHFKKEKTRPEEKLGIIEKVQGMTKPETQAFLFSVAENYTPPKVKDSIKQISATEVEVEFAAKNEFRSLIEEARGAFAHSNTDITFEELFTKIWEIAQAQVDPGKQVVRKYTKAPIPELKQCDEALNRAELRRDIFRRDGSKCTNCGSSYALEEEHNHARALGGEDSLENMRVLCRTCNQRMAIRVFGMEKMQQYLF